MSQENNKKVVKHLGPVIIIGFVGYYIFGRVGANLEPGWKDLLQGSFGFIWMVVGALIVIRKTRKQF